MKNQYILVALLIGLVVVAGAYLVWPKESATLPPVSPNGAPIPAPTPVNPPPPAYVPEDGPIQPVLPLENQADHVIDVTASGFSPSTLTVKKGESVIWTSRDRFANHQVVSIGTKYPEAGECGTKMDMCEPIRLGESFRATFNVVGTWRYNDKLNTQFEGTIIVE